MRITERRVIKEAGRAETRPPPLGPLGGVSPPRTGGNPTAWLASKRRRRLLPQRNSVSPAVTEILLLVSKYSLPGVLHR